VAIQPHRPLLPAEEIVDWEAIVRALDAGKDALERAIEAEKRRAIQNLQRSRRAHINLTMPMVSPLVTLRAEGRRQAVAEAKALGVTVGRAFAVNPVDPDDLPGDIAALLRRLQQILGALFVRVQHEAVELSLEGFSAAAIRTRLLRIPGARNAASMAVSKALSLGLSDVFAANEDAFSGWQYSSVADGATCVECHERDGRTYATLAEMYVDLPDFGPCPACLGGPRCRCRGVPLGLAA